MVNEWLIHGKRVTLSLEDIGKLEVQNRGREFGGQFIGSDFHDIHITSCRIVDIDVTEPIDTTKAVRVDTTQKIGEMAVGCDKMARTIEILQKESDEKTKEIERLKSELRLANRANTNLSAMNANQRDTINELHEQVVNLQSQCDTYKECNDRQLKMIESLTEENRRLVGSNALVADNRVVTLKDWTNTLTARDIATEHAAELERRIARIQNASNQRNIANCEFWDVVNSALDFSEDDDLPF